jgi:predicted nucleotidyltransferase
MDQATRDDLDTIKVSILKELSSIEAIYLFGSVAKGTENKASDYDILIFVNNMPDDDSRAIANIRCAVSKKIKRPLEAFILNVNDVKYPSPFLYEVYHDHRLLYGKNVIERFKEMVKNMKPLYVKGVKVGYYV